MERGKRGEFVKDLISDVELLFLKADLLDDDEKRRALTRYDWRPSALTALSLIASLAQLLLGLPNRVKNPQKVLELCVGDSGGFAVGIWKVAPFLLALLLLQKAADLLCADHTSSPRRFSTSHQPPQAIPRYPPPRLSSIPSPTPLLAAIELPLLPSTSPSLLRLPPSSSETCTPALATLSASRDLPFQLATPSLLQVSVDQNSQLDYHWITTDPCPSWRTTDATRSFTFADRGTGWDCRILLPLWGWLCERGLLEHCCSNERSGRPA